MKTKAKTFSTNVKGDWHYASSDHMKGKWLWEEAKEELLLQMDKWKEEGQNINILSIHFYKYSGRDIEAGASLELELIYEE